MNVTANGKNPAPTTKACGCQELPFSLVGGKLTVIDPFILVKAWKEGRGWMCCRVISSSNSLPAAAVSSLCSNQPLEPSRERLSGAMWHEHMSSPKPWGQKLGQGAPSRNLGSFLQPLLGAGASPTY